MLKDRPCRGIQIAINMNKREVFLVGVKKLGQRLIEEPHMKSYILANARRLSLPLESVREIRVTQPIFRKSLKAIKTVHFSLDKARYKIDEA